MQDDADLESSDLKIWINHGVVSKSRQHSWAKGQMNPKEVAYKKSFVHWHCQYIANDPDLIDVTGGYDFGCYIKLIDPKKRKFS